MCPPNELETPASPAPNAPVPAAPSPSPAPAPAAPAAPAPNAAGGPLPTVTPAPEPVAYQPNFKFKVMDKEHEMPEMFRALLKDADSEKQVKEIFEKAYGLDTVKTRFTESRETLKKVLPELQSYQQSVAELKDLYARDDLDGFFAKLKIPQEKLLQYVFDKLSYEKLPPEQRQVLDAQRAAENRAHAMEKRMTESEGMYQEQLVQAKGYALSVSLERPDVKQFAEAFDARVGKPGAFREEVISRGELAAVTRNLDISPEQAIKEVMTLFGGPSAAAPQTAAPGNPPTVTGKLPTGQKTQVIPNVSGKTTSPMAQPPKSIADLKNRLKELQA